MEKDILIDGIKKKGFPIVFIRGEADGSYGIWALSEGKVIVKGYAKDEYGKQNISLKELSLVDLASLLEKGEKEESQYYQDMINDIQDSNF